MCAASPPNRRIGGKLGQESRQARFARRRTQAFVHTEDPLNMGLVYQQEDEGPRADKSLATDFPRRAQQKVR